MKRRRWIGYLSLSLLALAGHLAAQPVPEETTVPRQVEVRSISNLPLRGQETRLWCWAASLEMISTHLGQPRSQCDLADAKEERGRARRERQDGVEPDAECCRPRSQWRKEEHDACVENSWPSNKNWEFERTKGRPGCEADDCALSWEALKAEIDEDDPVAFAWRWPGGGGHMMVASGYVEFPSESGIGRWVMVHNPWPPGSGDSSLVPYDYYLDGPHGHWRDYWNIRPRGRPANPVTQPVLMRSPGPEPSGDVPVRRHWHSEMNDARRAAAGALELIEALEDRELPFLIPPPPPVEGAAGEEEAPKLEIDWGIPVAAVSLEDLKRDGVKQLAEAEVYRNVRETLMPVVKRDYLVSMVTVRRFADDWRIVDVGRSNVVKSICECAKVGYQPGDLEVPKGVDDCYVRISELALADTLAIDVPECYQMFLLLRPDQDSERRVLVPVYDDENLGFSHGIAVPAKEVVDKLTEEGACRPALGGEDS